MGKNSNISGVFLDYVTREVENDVIITKTKFNPKKGENEQVEAKLKSPVIVFFPNGTSQVMSSSRAQEHGFLKRPKIIGINSVEDSESFAGKYKRAFHEKERVEAWLGLESELINKCISSTGHPLSLENTFSNDSLFVENIKEKEYLDDTQL